MFRVLITTIIRSTQNCDYSLRYWSYFCAATRSNVTKSVNYTHHQEYTKLWLQPPVLQLPPSNVAKLPWPIKGPLIVIHVNNCPTRCNTKQSIYYSVSSLYMFRVSTTPIIRSTQNCNYSLRYWSYFCAATTLQRGQGSLATLEGGSCSTGGCSHSFEYSWWWV